MNLRDAADPEGADSGDIGYGEGVTSYAFVVRQLAVEPSHFFLGVASADVTVGRDLLNAPFPIRMTVAEGSGHVTHQLKFHPPTPISTKARSRASMPKSGGSG
jgi:hypothetical protein